MGLFVCERCGCLENTATSNYSIDIWEGRPPLCHVCDERDVFCWQASPFAKRRVLATEEDRERVLNPEAIRRNNE